MSKSILDWPRATIVTPSYNQGRYLEDAIQSVLAQDYPNIEYMVIDGGSTDESVDVIRRHAEQLSYWVSEPDSGQSQAINKGWRLGTGDVLAWINADDMYTPGAVFEAVRFLIDHSACGMVCGNVMQVAAFDKSRILYRECARSRPLSRCLAQLISPGTTAAFIRRSALTDVGDLDETLHYWMDPELWIRIAQKWTIGHVNRDWYYFRVHEGSKTCRDRRSLIDEQMLVCTRLSADPQLDSSLRSASQVGLVRCHLLLGACNAFEDAFPESQACYRRAAEVSLSITARLLATDPRLLWGWLHAHCHDKKWWQSVRTTVHSLRKGSNDVWPVR